MRQSVTLSTLRRSQLGSMSLAEAKGVSRSRATDLLVIGSASKAAGYHELPLDFLRLHLCSQVKEWRCLFIHLHMRSLSGVSEAQQLVICIANATPKSHVHFRCPETMHMQIC